MRFSLRTLHFFMLAVFLFLMVAVVLPTGFLRVLFSLIVNLAAVALLIVAIYGRAKQQAFAIGALTAILLPWIQNARAGVFDSSPGFVFGSRLASLVWLLLWLAIQMGWIFGCGWLGAWMYGRLQGPPKPPPAPTPPSPEDRPATKP